VHEYASGLTSTPKAELFCSCKRRKFIGQNKVKTCKLLSQNFKFLGQKIGCLSHYQYCGAEIGTNYSQSFIINNLQSCLKPSDANLNYCVNTL